jgi:hypothetical protein
MKDFTGTQMVEFDVDVQEVSIWNNPTEATQSDQSIKDILEAVLDPYTLAQG